MQNVLPARWIKEWMQQRNILPRCAAHHRHLNASLSWSVWHRSDGITLNGEWYCSLECLESSVTTALHAMRSASTRRFVRALNRMPLGLMLLQRGEISSRQLRKALQLHASTGQRVGECLLQIRATSETAITTAVATQWACAVFPSGSIQPGAAELIPRALSLHHRMLPVHFAPASSSLFIAFSQRVDHTVLYAVEQILGLRTVPCLIEDSILADHIEARRELQTPSEIVVDTSSEPAEAAGIVRSYARQLRALSLRFVNCGEYRWFRIAGERGHTDLLFR